LSKPVYDKDWRYLPAAEEFHNRLHQTVRPIMEEFIHRGYNPRDLCYLAGMVAQDISLMAVLGRDDYPKDSDETPTSPV